MTIHPRMEGDESAERGALADLIDEHRDEIVARWVDRVQAELGVEIGAAQLRDAMPKYIACLSTALRGGDPLSQSGRAAWDAVAREHALARARLGFDVDQLVREFFVLRRVLFDVGREHGCAVQHAARIDHLLDAAVATAVRSYVQARDYEARKTEAKHVSFVTHELRDPLSAAKLAAVRLRRAVPQEAMQSFDMLERNLDRVGALIDGVLRVESLQNGKSTPRLTELPTGELLDQAIVSVRMAAEVKGLALQVSYDPHLLVKADPELARAAISTVLDNAVRYTDAGEIRVLAEPTGDRVTLHVWDNCPGLSEEELRVIFEPFERRHAHQPPGSGLGLAIAKRALEVQGGAIGADSRGERGCHFWISLPRAPH